MEGSEDVGAPFVADGDPSESGEPCQGALDHPSVAAQALAALDAAPGDPGNDGALAQGTPAVGEIVALVSVQFGGTTSWPAGALPDGRHGIDQRLQELAVVPIGGGDRQGEWDAIGIDENVALEPRLAAVGRVRPGLLTPLFAGTDALSTAARSQLMALA